MSRHGHKKKPPATITPELELAYVVCFWVYGHCDCRERGRSQVCETMVNAGAAARRTIEKQNEERSAARMAALRAGRSTKP